MALWNEPSRKEPISKDSPGLTAAVLSFMVVLATTGTATAQAVSGPSDGGSTGIVATTFASGFTMTTATGIEVTVDETYSTRTLDGSARAVRKDASVLVLGLDDTNTITADWVVIQPHGDGGAAAAEANGVIPFQSGVP